MTEKKLIEGCVQQDSKCQKEVFQRFAGKMMAVCLRYTRHHMEAEDIIQEAFIKVFNNIDKFQFKGSFEGWIRKIVVNTALKKYNKKSFQNEVIGLPEFTDQAADPVVYNALSVAEIMQLLAKLPDGYRVVFNLYAIEGYSHKEISDLLGIQESTSRSQLVKARKMLQSLVLDAQKIAV